MIRLIRFFGRIAWKLIAGTGKLALGTVVGAARVAKGTVLLAGAAGGIAYLAHSVGVSAPNQADLSKAYTDAAQKMKAMSSQPSDIASTEPTVHVKKSLADKMRETRNTPVLDGQSATASNPAPQVQTNTVLPASKLSTALKQEPFEDLLVRYGRNYDSLREATQSKAENRIDAAMIEREKLSLEISQRVLITPGSPRSPELESLEAARLKAENKAAIDDLYENLEALQKK